MPLAIASALAAPGCAGPEANGLRFVSAKARQEGDCYCVMALLENSTAQPIYLDAVYVEMTTRGDGGKVLASAYPITFDGTVRPGSTTRIPLNFPDREKQVRTSRLFLKNLSGRLLSEMEVGPIAGEDNTAGEKRDSPPSRHGQPPLELKILGAPE